MLFTGFHFWLFYVVVLTVIIVNSITAKHLGIQNVFLLISSYTFYGFWDYRFLSLIFISTVVDYYAGLEILRSARPKFWLLISLATNLGILCTFKYYDFFVAELVRALSVAGVDVRAHTLNVILPVGISFYTFQTLTYTIDIYRKHLLPTRDFIKFATFVAFFPQLVAGPIERAKNLLVQFDELWTFNADKVTEGLRLILFGLTLKIVIADNLAAPVDATFANISAASSVDLWVGTVYFAFQIYGDFCGYSTIAIGLAKILGFELMTNFNTPYLSGSIQEFWRRWHISLSTFFRDYVFIPLGGSRNGELRSSRNIMITFLLSGLWHGASITFIVWGFLHGAFLLSQRVLNMAGFRMNSHGVGRLAAVVVTFAMVCVSWVFFRSETIAESVMYIRGMFEWRGGGAKQLESFVFVFAAIFIDLLWRNDTRLEKILNNPEYKTTTRIARWLIYTIMIWSVWLFWGGNHNKAFIYFQF